MVKAVPSDDEVMTIDEVARYLRVAPSTVYRQAREGRIPARRVGHRWRFSRTAIDRWLRGRGGPPPVLKYAGAFREDETLDEMVAEIYRQRGRSIVGD